MHVCYFSIYARKREPPVCWQIGDILFFTVSLLFRPNMLRSVSGGHTFVLSPRTSTSNVCVCVCDTEVINLSHCVLSLFSSFVYKSSPMSYLCIVPVEDIILFLVWRMYEFFTWLAHHHLSWGSKRMETFSHDWFENISHLCSWHSWLWWWSSCASSQHHHHLFRVLYVTKLMCFDNVLVC